MTWVKIIAIALPFIIFIIDAQKIPHEFKAMHRFTKKYLLIFLKRINAPTPSADFLHAMATIASFLVIWPLAYYVYEMHNLLA